MKQFMEIGEVVSVHGLKGEMKVYPWADDPADFQKLNQIYFDPQGLEAMQVLQARVQKGMVYLKLQDVTTVEEARKYIRRTVYFNRDDLPLNQDRFFVQDLLGMLVKDGKTGKPYGKLINITNTGASDIYHIQDETGKVHLFPAAKEFLQEFNIQEGYILINPIEGMFDTDAD